MHKPKEIITSHTDWLLSERPDDEHLYLDSVEVEMLQEYNETKEQEHLGSEHRFPARKLNKDEQHSKLSEKQKAFNLAKWILRREEK